MTNVDIVGYLKNADNTPATGQVEFTLTAELRDPTNNVVIPRTTVKVPLGVVDDVSDPGHFKVTLVSTEDVGVLPAGAKYVFVQRLTNGPAPPPATFSLPTAPGTQDIADLLP